MKRFLLLVLGVILFAGCTISNRVIYLGEPTALDVDSLDVQTLLEENAEHDIVYLSLNKSYEHVTQKEAGGVQLWDYFEVLERKYIIINPDIEEFTTFTLYVPKNCVLGSLHLKTTSPEGEVDFFSKSEAIVEKNSDGSKYKVVYPKAVKGTIIEESYELTYPGLQTSVPLRYNIDLQFNNPCKELTFKYAYPDWWDIKVKKIAKNKKLKLTQTDDAENHKTIVKYHDTDIPAYKYEQFSPFFKETGKYLQFKVTDLQIMGHTVIIPSSWSALAKDYEQYTMRKEGFLAMKVRKTTKGIIKDCESDYEKMEAIVNYVQENIEIVADGETRSFADIIKEGKGDYFRVTGLAMSMMKRADLNVEYIVSHNAKDGYFDMDYVDYSQLTFPALQVLIGTKEYIVFPGIKYLPVDHIPEYFAGQKAMVIPDLMESTTNSYTPHKPKFLKMPASNSKDNTIVENYQISIDEEGYISVEEEKILNGASAYLFREILSEKDENEIDDIMEDILTYTEGDVNVTSYKIENRDEYKKPLSIILNYEIDNLVTVTPEEIIFQTGGLFSPSSLKKYKIKTKDRVNPIKIHYDQIYEKNIAISFPDSWKMQSKFEDVNIENVFGSAAGSYEVAENTFTVKQTRSLNKVYKSKESIKELMEMTGKKSQLYISNIIFDVIGE